MRNEETYVASGTHVHFAIYLPKIMIRYRGVVQIHHGFEEHHDRYLKFATYLANQGYVVVTTDFAGHGRSLRNFNQGNFAEGDATITLVEDMERLRGIIASRYQSIPYFIMGYQLGSLVLKKYMAKYGNQIDGAILLGTNGQNPFGSYRALLKFYSLFSNENKQNSFIQQLVHRKLSKLSTPTTYLTSDVLQLKNYYDDPFNDFAYTTKAYKEIIRMLDQTASTSLINKIPKELPILMLSGKEDFFGDYGRGVEWLYRNFKKSGIKDIKMKVYSKMKMDILHEEEKKRVYRDITSWLNHHTYL